MNFPFLRHPLTVPFKKMKISLQKKKRFILLKKKIKKKEFEINKIVLIYWDFFQTLK